MNIAEDFSVDMTNKYVSIVAQSHMHLLTAAKNIVTRLNAIATHEIIPNIHKCENGLMEEVELLGFKMLLHAYEDGSKIQCQLSIEYKLKC